MIRLTHNGMTVKFFENEMEALNYIQSERVKDLKSKLLVEQTETDSDGIIIRKVIIYQYYTLYSEMFLLEYKY